MPFCTKCGAEGPDGAHFCPACGVAISPAAPRETRRTITVLLCDVRDSTGLGERLQPEAFRSALTQYIEAARTVFEAHGGTVYPPSGDGILAAFGIPKLHEDDALRAVRAAVEFRDALPALNRALERELGVQVAVRIGINTGEIAVEVGAQRQPPLLGDVPNIAARLEHKAAPGEIVLGVATWLLVRDLVSVEPLGPLTLPGRSEPVLAYRLHSLVTRPSAQRPTVEADMIGREQELAWLRLAYDRTRRERTCHLVNVLGPEGIGKSRLASEFARTVAGEAAVLRGSCLSYGKGMTFWPIAVAIRQAAGISGNDPPEVARSRLAALVGGQDQAEQITTQIAQLVGLTEPGGDARDSTFWGLWRFLEVFAGRRPAVLIIDDLHWAEPTLLDLIEYVTNHSRQSPLLIICLAREVLLEDRPTWSGGKLNVSSMLLSALTHVEAGQLVAQLAGRRPLPSTATATIVQTAEGNPLFIEELVATTLDRGSRVAARPAAESLDKGSVPPKIRALLEARLDQLEPEERMVLERAAVVGVHFSVAAVLSISEDLTGEHLETILDTLVAKELIRPHAPDVTAGSAFRFRHGLIRETAYNTLPLRPRAMLHERLADFSARTLGDRAREVVEVTAHHLREAHRYRTRLGPADEHGQRLARRAGELFAEAGRRASLRGDIQATVSLLNQAVELLPDDHPNRLETLLVLAEALGGAGDLGQATSRLETAIKAARKAGDSGLMMHAVLGRLTLQWYTDLETTLHQGPGEVEQAARVFTQLGDDDGLSNARRVLAQIQVTTGRCAAARETIGLAIDAARRARNQRLEASALGWACWITWFGPSPLSATIAEAESVLAWAEHIGSRHLEAHALRVLARAHAMRGDFPKARALLGTASTITIRLGEVLYGADANSAGFIELLARDYPAAERHLRHSYETLARFGTKNQSAAVAGLLARVLVAQDRITEAEHFASISQRTAASKDVDSQVKWRRARARILASRHRFADAERLARQEVAVAAQTDWPDLQAETHIDLAHILRLADRPKEAHRLVHEALELYHRKGNLVGARMAEAFRDELVGSPAALPTA